MFSDLLLETATLNKVLSRNEYGEESYGDDITIKCRKEESTKSVRNQRGEEVVSSETVYTNYTDIAINDNIDDKPVISVKKIKEINGNIVVLAVMLK